MLPEVDLMEYELRGDYPLSREEFHERMRMAEEHLFILGLGDAAEEVGRVNASLFLAKMHCIQEKLGYKPMGMIIGPPDFTFQTTPHKFRDVIPEGSKIIWGDGRYDLIPGEMEFDFCGLLAGAVENDISLRKILDRLYEMRDESYEIDGIEIQLRNFSPGSHFLNLYEVKNYEALSLPKRVAVLHTSSDEMRDPLMDFVQEKAEVIETPFGSSHVLQDSNDVREYEKQCRYASEFARKKRKLLFRELFGNGKVIANHNHYELLNRNEAVIGCNIVNKEGEVFVTTLIDTSPVFLIKGKNNLSPRIIEELGFDSKITEKWVYNRLVKANILCHGGGHKLIEIDGIEKVLLYPNGKKVIVPKYGTEIGTRVYVDMTNTPRTYRSQGILERVQSLELGEHYATLQFTHGIKVDF